MSSKELKPEDMNQAAGGFTRTDMKAYERLIKKQQAQREDFERRRAEMESLAQQRLEESENQIREAMKAGHETAGL